MNYKEINGQLYKLAEVARGSHEWARYSLLSGKKVRYSGWAPNQYIHMHEGEPDLIFDESNGIYCELGELRPGNYWEIYEEPLLSPGSLEWAKDLALKGVKITREGIEPDESFALRDDGEFWISKNGWRRTIKQYEDGWQIYTEPKPLLADAKEGWLVINRAGHTSTIKYIDNNNGVLKYAYEVSDGTTIYVRENGMFNIINHNSNYDIVSAEPLAPEGSAEWAWQMMLLSNMVIPTINQQTPWKLIDNRAETEISCASHTRENWVKVASDRVWQIYTEPEPQYKVGDWVEYRLTTASDNNMMGQIIDIGRIGGTSIEVLPVGNYEHNSSLSTYHVIYASRIIRKLKPSEVIVNIGCLSGTVEDLSYADNGRFFLVGKATERHPVGMYSILYKEMLDTPTSNLVESLLKAQEEEK